MNAIKSLFMVIAASLFLVACQSKSKDLDKIIPAQDLYNAGIKELEAKNYTKAANEFETVFFQHPGNSITADAELMQAYSLYLAGEYDEVGDVLDIFLKLHPRHENVAYAYYLKALANYVQISSVKLDQSRTRYAKEGLEEVISRFPGSKYAIDAALKIDLVNDHLAGKQMLVGRYYLTKKNPVAAIKRFQTVVEEYDTTTHIPEALHRLVESNLMLGLKDEAKKYADVLMHNYPKSSWNNFSKNLLK
jgi:outer membrane protein assembly factor BamD